MIVFVTGASAGFGAAIARTFVKGGHRVIAARLEAFAALLELAEANPYTARAYRRAAETIRATPAPVAELVRTARVRRPLAAWRTPRSPRQRTSSETLEIFPDHRSRRAEAGGPCGGLKPAAYV